MQTKSIRIADHWLAATSATQRKNQFQKELEAWANLREPERIAAEIRHYGRSFPLPIGANPEHRSSTLKNETKNETEFRKSEMSENKGF